MFALQFAKAIGAEVIMTYSSDEKLSVVKNLVVSHTINNVETPDWDEDVKNFTEGKGVKAVVEVGGLGTVNKSIACLGMSGKIGMIGVLAGEDGECHPRNLMLTGSSIHGIFVGSRSMFERMNNAIEKYAIRPVIDKVFSFDARCPGLF
jgi:NADPH:quinone reductase-like Zn-dependent oxidoreductase